MQTIWKYKLSTPVTSITMPKGAQILTVQLQGDDLCMWALVDSERQVEERLFERHVTGGKVGPVPHMCNRKYIGTVQDAAGFVFHVFEDENFAVSPGNWGSPKVAVKEPKDKDFTEVQTTNCDVDQGDKLACMIGDLFMKDDFSPVAQWTQVVKALRVHDLTIVSEDVVKAVIRKAK